MKKIIIWFIYSDFVLLIFTDVFLDKYFLCISIIILLIVNLNDNQNQWDAAVQPLPLVYSPISLEIQTNFWSQTHHHPISSPLSIFWSYLAGC